MIEDNGEMAREEISNNERQGILGGILHVFERLGK